MLSLVIDKDLQKNPREHGAYPSQHVRVAHTCYDIKASSDESPNARYFAHISFGTAETDRKA